MEIAEDRIECAVRLLQNGRYTWTITINEPQGNPEATANHIKQMDGALRNAFPNHVKENSVKFSELD